MQNNYIDSIIETVKALPVQCSGNFGVADAWVGVVMAIEQLKHVDETVEEVPNG